MTDFTSNDTILSRLHMASAYHTRTSSSSSDTLNDSQHISYGDKHDRHDRHDKFARPSAWSRLYPSRLHGARLKRLLLLAMSAAMLTIFYLRTNTAPIHREALETTTPSTPETQDTPEKDLRIVSGSAQKVTWSAVTDSPQIEANGKVVKEKTPLAFTDFAATADITPTEVCVSFPEMVGVDPHRASLLAHIPAKIWQVYLDFNEKSLSHQYLLGWLNKSPSYAYSVLDAAGALAVVGKLVSMAELGTYRVSTYPFVRIPRVQAVEAAADAAEGGDSQETQNENKKRDDPYPPPTPPEVSSLQWARDALLQYAHMPRRVLRADFMRYLVLALEGGVYSDIDTHLIKSIHNWVPEEHRDKVKLIVGLEADRSPPIFGTTYEIQFCQWTLASAPDHPTMWTMLEKILSKARLLDAGASAERNYSKLTDTDVLEITGPAAWTEVVYEHLNAVAGDGVGNERITWSTLTGMREPRLLGDTLVLPIDGFATGVPHSGASMSNGKETLVRHQFQGKWRDDRG